MTPQAASARAYHIKGEASVAERRATQAALIHGFDNVCGDTFCGSDYGDLQALDLACSITKSTGNVKSCVWIFGGSFATVAPSGALAASPQLRTIAWVVGQPVTSAVAMPRSASLVMRVSA